MKDQCKAAVAKALGKAKLSQQEAIDIENRIKDAMKSLAKKDLQKWRNLSDADKLTEAGKQVAIDIQEQLKRKHKIAAQDILSQNKNLALLDHPTLSASEVVDRMVAPHGDMSGIQSLDSKARGIAAIYRGDLVEFYTNVKGGLGIFTDKDLVQKIVRERFNDSTGDVLAKQISDKMGEVFEGMRQRFNRSGGDIGKLDDWGLPQTHNLEKIAVAGKQTWVDKAEGLIDTSKYVHEDGSYYSQQQIRELLEYSFDTLTSNGANKTEIGRQSFGGNSKVTSRHSESRVLHFKDADAWMEYQSEYGGMQFVDLVEAHISGLSKDIALAENLGSNPKGSMKILMDAAEKKDWLNGLNADATGKSRKRAQMMFDEFMGQNTPQSQILANGFLAYRSMNVASMLGGTTLSSITDQAMIAKTASVHNIAYRKTFGELIKHLNPANKEDRKLAHSLGLATQEMLGSIARWADDGLTSVHGKSEAIARSSSSLATQVLRVSGLNALTAASKVGFTKILMDKYGTLTRTKNWSDLDALDRELLEGTGLSERAWEVMRLAEPVVDRNGNQLMSARSIYEIPNDKLLAKMDNDVKRVVDNINNQVDELNKRNLEDDQRLASKSQRIDDIKQQLSTRLQDYANRKDAKANAEKQALQDRIDLLDAQKEAAAAQSDMNAYLRTVKNSENLKGFMDGITQGKSIDRIASGAQKLGRELESLDNKISQKSKKITDNIRTYDKEIQQKFKDLTDLLSNKTKLKPEQLKEYENTLAERLNKYAGRRDVDSMRQVDGLNSLKDLVALKQEQISKQFEIEKAVEQSKLKTKTDNKIDASVSSYARQNYASGENLGKRIGNAERRITELRARTKKADSEANKAITKKYQSLDKRVQELDNEFSEYSTRVTDRQTKRQHVMDRLNKSIDGEKQVLAQKIKDEIASQFQAHLLDEQGMAVIEAGLRERTMLQIGNKGTPGGEIWRSMTQFKSFPTAFLMRHGSRAMSLDKGTSKAAYLASLFAMTTALGALVVQLKELASGNDPQIMYDEDDPQKAINFFTRSAVQGGGLSFIGDILVAGQDATGRGLDSFMVGPFGNDVKTVAGLTVGNFTQYYEGKDTNATNEAYKAIKGKIPAQNLWYTKAATNRMIFDEMQDMIAPGYREKLLRKAERKHDRTRFWGDDLGDIQAPDFERVVQ